MIQSQPCDVYVLLISCLPAIENALKLFEWLWGHCRMSKKFITCLFGLAIAVILAACSTTATKTGNTQKMMDEGWDNWLIFIANPLAPKFGQTVFCSQWVQSAPDTPWRLTLIDEENLRRIGDHDLILEVVDVAYRCELGRKRGTLLVAEAERRQLLNINDIEYVSPDSNTRHSPIGTSASLMLALYGPGQSQEVQIAGRTYRRYEFERQYVCRDYVYASAGLVVGRSTDYCNMPDLKNSTTEVGVFE